MVFFNFLARLSHTKRGILKGIAAGFPFVLSNLWIFVLYASMFPFFRGQRSTAILVFFPLSALILILTNILGVSELQSAYKIEAVSLVAPVQQIPIQIAPLFYYFFIFNYTFLDIKSIADIALGVFLILVSGFILSGKNKLNY